MYDNSPVLYFSVPHKALYHKECIKALSSIPSILKHTADAIVQGENIKSLLDLTPIKNGVYKVLESTCKDMKDISHIAEKSSFHIEQLRETMEKHPKTSRDTVVANFVVINKSVQEGEQKVKHALNEIEKLQTEIDSVQTELASCGRPKKQDERQTTFEHRKADGMRDEADNEENAAFVNLDNDGSSGCRGKHESLKRNNGAREALEKSKGLLKTVQETFQEIFLDWNEYKKYFDSIHDSIMHGRDVTEQQPTVLSEEFSLTNTIQNLNVYVKSIKTSTRSFVLIYNEDLSQMVRDFYTGKVDIPENVNRRIDNRYYELLKKEGQSTKPVEV